MNEANYNAYKKILKNHLRNSQNNLDNISKIKIKFQAELILEAQYRAEVQSFTTALSFLNSAHENFFVADGD